MRTEADYRALIAQGLRGDGRYSVEDVIEGIKSGTLQLFEEPEGIIVTQMVQLRTKRLIAFLLAGSNFREWMERAIGRLKGFQADQSCDVLEFYCKPGLARILKDIGVIENVLVRIK